ncbi:F-box/WD-40 repeat-containing protein, partial [Mucuna pruriens]
MTPQDNSRPWTKPRVHWTHLLEHSAYGRTITKRVSIGRFVKGRATIALKRWPKKECPRIVLDKSADTKLGGGVASQKGWWCTMVDSGYQNSLLEKMSNDKKGLRGQWVHWLSKFLRVPNLGSRYHLSIAVGVAAIATARRDSTDSVAWFRVVVAQSRAEHDLEITFCLAATSKPSEKKLQIVAWKLNYFDPEAVVGCDDGAVRVFDMYSRRCSQIIRMHYAPITCLCLSEDQLIVSGSTTGSITISDPSSVQPVATLGSSDARGIRTLCFNPSSQLLFAGSTVGYTYCWDLRTRKLLWSNRVSPNVIYSLQHLQSDTSLTSTLAVGGIDGILRLLNQNDGSIVSSCVLGDKLLSTFQSPSGSIQRRKGRRLPEGTYININLIPKTVRPSITCLAVGMKKIVTTHNTNDIRLWKFESNISL